MRRGGAHLRRRVTNTADAPSVGPCAQRRARPQEYYSGSNLWPVAAQGRPLSPTDYSCPAGSGARGLRDTRRRLCVGGMYGTGVLEYPGTPVPGYSSTPSAYITPPHRRRLVYRSPRSPRPAGQE